MRTWQAHGGRVNGLAFSPEGRRLASCGYDQFVRVWDPATGAKLLELAGDRAPSGGPPWTAAVAFSRCGRWVAAAHSKPSLGGPDNVRVWDAATGNVVANHRCGSSSGGLAFTAADPPGLLVTDFPRLLWYESALRTGRPTVIKHDRGRELPKPSRVAVSPDGSRVATNGRYKAVVWDAEMTALAVLKHPKTPNNGPVAFHPSGEVVAAGRATKVDLWRFGDRKAEPVELAGHKRPVWGVGFTPDGRTVLTAASDGTVRLWDAGTGAPGRAFDFGLGKLYAAAFAPDGLTAAAGGEDGRVVLWDVDV